MIRNKCQLLLAAKLLRSVSGHALSQVVHSGRCNGYSLLVPLLTHHQRRFISMQPVSLASHCAAFKCPDDVEDHEHPQCWKCGSAPARPDCTYFCQGCGVIQPAKNHLNYFQLLGIQQTFDIDTPSLEHTYRDFQRQLHPDKFSTASPEERKFSDDQASLVNAAYSTLKVPLKRALYMLELSGYKGEEHIVEDPQLLMEIMEAREKVEETADKKQLKQMLETNQKEQAGLVKAISEAFQHNDYMAASQLVTRLKYASRVAESIINKL